MQVENECAVCGEPIRPGWFACRSFIDDRFDIDRVWTFASHPDCDENATPEELNAIRDAILGE